MQPTLPKHAFRITVDYAVLREMIENFALNTTITCTEIPGFLVYTSPSGSYIYSKAGIWLLDIAESKLYLGEE